MRAETRATGHPMGWFVGGVLVVASLVLYGRPQGVTGNTILIVGIVLALIAVGRGLRHPRMLLLPWAFVALAAFSAFWSDQRWTTFTLAVALAVPLFIAGLIAKNIPFDRFLKIADWTLRLLVVVSLAAAVIVPEIGITQRDVNADTLRGIYEHRNGMGLMAVLAIITLLARRWGNRKIGSWVLFLLLDIVALAWAGSAGALVLLVVTFCVYAVARWLSGQTPATRGLMVIAILCLLTVVVVLGAPFLPQVFELFGRDLTFTNRIYIWQGAVEAWQQRFWTGYGWANILGDNDEAAATIGSSAGYAVRSTHNGYLATALQLGVVGLALSILFLIVTFVRVWKMTLRAPGPKAVWSLQIVLILILGDFVETRAFVNLGWFLLCVAAYYAAPVIATREEQRRPAISQAQRRPLSSRRP